MGGKARRRRQRNYERAHSTGLQLPPPPSGKVKDAVPRKLQTLMKLMDKKTQGKDVNNVETSRKEKANKEKPDITPATPNQENPPSKSEPKSRKRKRKADMEQFAESLKAQEGGRTSDKRKKYLKERKNKKKQKKPDTEDTSLKQLYQHEDVKFGEVVDAPPKLPPIRKNKAGLEASQERLRLQAVEAYRQKRAWESRPGMKMENQTSTS